MYAVYTNIITLTNTDLDKSVDYRYTLKATESCMISLHNSTTPHIVELCKLIMQSFCYFEGI